MNALDQIFGLQLFIGFCDECKQAKPFRSERERDLWQLFHTHNPEASA